MRKQSHDMKQGTTTTAVKDPNWPELTKVEVEICKENFIFWDKLRQGYIDRPLLRMFLKGFNFVSVDHEKQKLVEGFLDEKNLQYLDLPALLSVLSFLKELELKDEEIVDNEYGMACVTIVDAFVAMGGDPERTGTIKKSKLIEIIKEEFELTIDMEEYLQRIGGESDDIDFFQFCLLLDAGTSGNPSRVSSIISMRSMSQVDAM